MVSDKCRADVNRLSLKMASFLSGFAVLSALEEVYRKKDGERWGIV
jgi:hypothetical protein